MGSAEVMGEKTRREAMVKTSTPEVSAITAGTDENTSVLSSTVSHCYHYRQLREGEIFLTS